MNYKVKRRFRRGLWAYYTCPTCGDGLESPLGEAGTSQNCPTCKAAFVTPGALSLQAEKDRAAAEAVKAGIRRSQKGNRKNRPAIGAASKPPEHVWYGRMRCGSCGYHWTSRRSSPPAKCAGCSSRNIFAIRQPKHSIGCVGMILITAGIVLLLLLFMAANSGPNGSGRDNYVGGYNRANGTHVNGYYRSDPGWGGSGRSRR